MSRQNRDFSISIEISWSSRLTFWNCQDFLDRQDWLFFGVETNRDPQGYKLLFISWISWHFLRDLIGNSMETILPMVTNILPMLTNVYPMLAEEFSGANPLKVEKWKKMGWQHCLCQWITRFLGIIGENYRIGTHWCHRLHWWGTRWSPTAKSASATRWHQ